MYSRTISEINLIKKDNKIQVKLYKEEETPKEPYTVEINHKNKNDEINIDRTGKLDGRGAYICDNVQCLEKIIKSKRLEKIFDKEISNEIYEKLRGVILDK